MPPMVFRGSEPVVSRTHHHPAVGDNSSMFGSRISRPRTMIPATPQAAGVMVHRGWKLEEDAASAKRIT